jgi:hypothetical protein
MPATIPAPDALDDATAVAMVKSTVERFQQHAGPLNPSPFYGEMTNDEGTQLQLRHFEHHFGFLTPN